MKLWIVNHPAEAWFIISAFLNLALRVRTPEQWIALGERHPWAALAIRQVRAWGMDPTASLRAVQKFAAARAGGEDRTP